MLKRTNIILTVLLIAQIVIASGLALTSNSTTVVSDEPLLADFSSESVIEMIIQDDLDNQVRFVRSDDSWVLPSADDFLVNSIQVEDVLTKVGTFKTNRLIATNPTSHTRLEVQDEDFRRKLTLISDEGSEEILFGTDGGVNTTHTRRAGDNNVYLTTGLNSWELQTQISSWIDTAYVDIEQDSVTRLIMTNASGTFEFERGEVDWAYLGLGEDEVFDTSKISSLLRNATTVRMIQPLGLEAQDDYGLDEPEITIQVFYEEPVETEDTDDEEAADSEDEEAVNADGNKDAELERGERSYTLTIGKPLSNGEYVIKADNKEYYVQVRSSFAATFRDVDHNALLFVQADDSNTDGN